MVDQRLACAGLHDFATWAPVLRLLRDRGTGQRSDAVARATGRIGRGSWSLPLEPPRPRPGSAAQVDDLQEEFDAVGRVREALEAAGVDDVSFSVKFAPTGQATLRVMGPSPAVESGIGTAQPGALILVDGAVPEPWRRLPDPMPGAVPAPTADPALLARTLRERGPDAVGATDAEIAATEARLGVALPEELKALYQVAHPTWEHGSETADEAAERIDRAVGGSSSRWTPSTSPTPRPVPPPGATAPGRRSSPSPMPPCRAWSARRAGSCSETTAGATVSRST